MGHYKHITTLVTVLSQDPRPVKEALDTVKRILQKHNLPTSMVGITLPVVNDAYLITVGPSGSKCSGRYTDDETKARAMIKRFFSRSRGVYAKVQEVVLYDDDPDCSCVRASL